MAWSPDLVVVIASRGAEGDRLLGTGTVLASRRILTARHVVCAPDGSAKPGLCIGLPNDAASPAAHVVWSGSSALDVAVLEAALPGPAPADTLALFSSRDLRTEEPWEVRGYPAVRKENASTRLESISGRTGLYSSRTDHALTLNASAHPDEWGGLSGGAVVIDGRIVGIVRAMPLGWSGKRMEATPVASFLTEPGFRDAMGLGPAKHALSATAALPAVERFVGRSAELAELADLLQSHESDLQRIAVVCGVGGTGKTALARRFAELHARQHPGGLLWADMGTNQDKGERGAARSPDYAVREALERWETNLGGKFESNRPIHVLLGSVQRLIAERKETLGEALVVLDNVDVEDALDILSALTDCPVVVTARTRELADARNLPLVRLGGLDRAASREYVERTLGANDPRTVEVGRLLDYIEDHPLALTLIVSVLAEDPSLTPSLALDVLKGWGALPSLDACFHISIERLPKGPILPLLIATASLSPVSWPVAALDYVAGVGDVARTRALLADLRKVGLVEALGDDRFRVHRLIRDHLRSVHGGDGFGFIPVTWELSSLPWWLLRLHIWQSAGFAVYDLRQETYFLRAAKELASNSQGLPEEWDNLALAVARRAGPGFEYVLRVRLELLRKLLRGADLSRMSLQRSLLDGATLDQARLEESDLSSRPLCRWPSREAFVAWLPRTIVEVVFAMLALAASYALVLRSVGAEADRKVLWLGLLGGAVVLPERCGQLVFESGFWFDEHSIAARTFLERLAIFFSTFVFVTVAGLLLAWMTGQSPREMSVLAGMLSVTAIMLSLSRWWTADLLRSLTRRGFGGFSRRLAALWMMSTPIFPAVGCVVLYANQGASASEAFRVLTLVSAALCGIFGLLLAFVFAASRNPELAGLPVYSVRASYLRGASLVGADLRGAKLSWARLQRANLINARLDGAELDHADLRGADLRGLDLRKTKLEGARLEGVIQDEQTQWPEGLS